MIRITVCAKHKIAQIVQIVTLHKRLFRSVKKSQKYHRLLVLYNNNKHRHRRNVTSHHFAAFLFTSFHFFDYFHFFEYLHFFEYFHLFNNFQFYDFVTSFTILTSSQQHFFSFNTITKIWPTGGACINWPTFGATCSSCKFGYQSVPLELV